MFDIINNNNYILYSVYILIFLRYSIFKLLLSLYVPLLLFSIHFVVLCILAGEKLVRKKEVIFGLRATTATNAACIEPLIPCVTFILATIFGFEQTKWDRTFYLRVFGVMMAFEQC